MKKAKPEHRRDYWKYHSAMFAFEQAGDLIKRLASMTDREPLFYPLMIALHVLYSHPYRHDKGSRNIEESMIPDDLQHVHKLVLQLRDRVFAHHDKTSRVIDEASGEDLSQLVIRIRNGVIAPGIQTVFPTGAQLTNMLRLCRVLYDRCKAKGAVALGKCTTTPPPDGIYTVSTVFEGRAPLFTPMKTIKRTDSGQTKDAHGSR